jgi:Arc/MetJ-type ribon-helix-helix transcriptional regulator
MADTVKVTVTLPTEQLAELKSRVRNGEIESVSGFVTATVADRLKREAWVRRWRARVGEPDPEAAAWANAIIDEFVLGEQERRAS